MATIAGPLLLLLSGICTVEVRTLSGINIETLNATIDGAKAKFSSDEYFYLDDSSPGDYFDGIVSMAKILMSIYNESNDEVMVPAVRTFMQFFKEASSKVDDQGTPFGKRECRLLPKQFRNCHIEPNISESMSVMGDVLRSTPIYLRNYADRYPHLIRHCEAFDIDAVLEMTTKLTGEQCDKGLGKDGSMEQDMQRRMMEYAEANGFEGGSENKCLPHFVASFTRSAQAVRIFKSSVDKYLLAATTLQAFCTVFQRTSNEEENRAKAVETQGMLAKSLARVQINDSVSWACDDIQAKIDADISALDAARFREIIDNATGKVSSDDYFYKDSSAADYFDSLSTAAGSLALALKATTTNHTVEKQKMIEAFTSLFRDLSSTTDEQAAPFGINECWLLPRELSDSSVVPIISTSLNAIQAKLGDYDGIVKVCKTSNVDGVLKTLRALIGRDCEEGLSQNDTTEAAMRQNMARYAEEHQFEGGSENNCLHLFVARHTNSEEAVQMFKKSFDKYLLVSITIQAVCTGLAPRCNEEAYRTHVLDTHASFAPSLARTASIQLNDTTPWKCDDSQQAIISNTTEACERVRSTAASDTSLLAEKSAGEFESMMFEMAEALTYLHEKIYKSYDDATTPRKKEVSGRTQSAVLDQLKNLLTYLANLLGELSIPFGKKDDGLLPPDARCPPFRLCKKLLQFSTILWFQDQVFPVDKLFEHVEINIWWRESMLSYAITHDFDGCGDNKCFQTFIARYTNHSNDALEKLQHSMDKYVYISVFLKSFCDSFFGPGPERSERRNETLLVVRSMKDGLDLVKNLSRAWTSCAVDAKWAEKVDSYASDVIDAKTKYFKPKSWEDRQQLHEDVAKDIVGRFYQGSYTYTVLAYLPYADDERRGFVKLPNNVDVVRNVSNSVNYVVTRRLSASFGDQITNQWASIEKNASDILKATFSTRATNLTQRIEEVEQRFGPFLKGSGFRALAALRCGHEFVWYELGYRYFRAGYATGDHALFTDYDNKYSDKCGQIIFFP